MEILSVGEEEEEKGCENGVLAIFVLSSFSRVHLYSNFVWD